MTVLEDQAYWTWSLLFYVAGPGKQRLLLNSLMHWRVLPVSPSIWGVNTQEDVHEVILDLRVTCARLGLDPDEVIVWDRRRGTLSPGPLTLQACWPPVSGTADYFPMP